MNTRNHILVTAIAQFFVKLNKRKIEEDRKRPDFNSLDYDKDNPIQFELVCLLKERIGTTWINLDRDIYFSIHHYYELYHEKKIKGNFSNNNNKY